MFITTILSKLVLYTINQWWHERTGGPVARQDRPELRNFGMGWRDTGPVGLGRDGRSGTHGRRANWTFRRVQILTRDPQSRVEILGWTVRLTIYPVPTQVRKPATYTRRLKLLFELFCVVHQFALLFTEEFPVCILLVWVLRFYIFMCILWVFE